MTVTAMGLRLPLCPKCGDTKNAQKKPTQMLGCNTQFECLSCKIEWRGSSSSNGFGTIVDGENEYYV